MQNKKTLPYLVINYNDDEFITTISNDSLIHQKWQDVFKIMISDKNDKIFVECWDFNLENTNKTNFIASGILEIKNIDLSIIDKNKLSYI
jgi:hypothetical protein